MHTDGPAAPTEKSVAKHADTKALLHYVTKICQRHCQRHWPTAHSSQLGLQSTAPAPKHKYDGVIDWIGDMASIGDEFDDLVRKATRLSGRRHLSDADSKEFADTVADAEGAAKYGKELGQRVKTLGAKMIASGQRDVYKLLTILDKLGDFPEHTERFRAGI